MVGEDTIPIKSCIKLLGVKLDYTLSFSDHIAEKCRLAALGVQNITSLRKYLDINSAKKLASSLVLSHFDYCNALLFKLPESSIQNMQRIQNWAAKVVLGRGKYDSATDALRDCHWLPIKARVQYKLLVLVFKSMNGLAPIYLQKLLTPKNMITNRRTRSYLENNLLSIPFTKKKTYADRAFSVAGPTEWNKLPAHLRDLPDISSFKRNLKTHFF
jgi:hypothetical protein